MFKFCVYVMYAPSMYECLISRKLPENWKPSVWRSGLPRYAMRVEFYTKILDFNGVYASCHAGQLPPPPPKLLRQDANDPVLDPIEAMEEGRPPVKVHAEIFAPHAPIKVHAEDVPFAKAIQEVLASYSFRKVRMIAPKRLEYESDDDPDDDMYV
jgi:hypothetical protein